MRIKTGLTRTVLLLVLCVLPLMGEAGVDSSEQSSLQAQVPVSSSSGLRVGEVFVESSGHDVPTPFYNAPYFELAEGEVYELWGWIEAQSVDLDQGRVQLPFLHVDLTLAPWLASQKRRQSPYYLLEGSLHQWRNWVGKKVRMTVFVQRRLVHTAAGPKFPILLTPVPTRVSR